MTGSTTDDATDRRLLLLVSLVVVCGLANLAVALNAAVHEPATVGVYPAAFFVLCAVAAFSNFKIRIRSTALHASVVSSAVLLAAISMPTEWVPICAAGGCLIWAVGARLPARKVAFNVAKEGLAATAAAGTIAAFQLTPAHPMVLVGDVPHRLIAMFAASVAYAAIDEGLTVPVLALASGTRIRQRRKVFWDERLLLRFGAYCLAVGATATVEADRWFLVALPPLLYALHMVSASRVRGREEREAWQQLANTTDQLNSVDIDIVLRTAVSRAAELFSADQVEIELRPSDGSGPRLIRGNSDTVTHDGVPETASASQAVQITMILKSRDGAETIGELRLCFRGRVTLSERENYALRTFTGALCTAIRNASAFAETQRLAADHALSASIDPLTGLANRRKLNDHGAEILERHRDNGVAALLLVDLNHFKEINDTLGHTAGDQVLTEIAHRLAATASPTDLVARLGGDEFAVLIAELPAPTVAVPRAHNILAALATPIEVDGTRISVEASGGIAVADDTGIDELLRRADVAMYQAKRGGRRVSVYDSTRDTADVDSLALGGDLARAVSEGQFVVAFQPIVDMGSGAAIAAEALARWNHPEHGLLAPSRFLDTVERSAQLPAFAEYILDQALIAAAAWRADGHPIPVAVNVSPRSLLDPGFPTMVLDRLNVHSLPADALVLELTESLTLSQRDVVDTVLGALRKAGVGLALDDFGTGYSSMSTVPRIPVHELKIDRGFVAAMDSTIESAVIRSMVELGRSLDRLVVAEGVEREEQRRRLWELGCPAGQGYLFAPAIPPEELLERLRIGFAGNPGAFAAPLHSTDSVIRIPRHRPGDDRPDDARLGPGRAVGGSDRAVGGSDRTTAG